jgi:hypothetical protein
MPSENKELHSSIKFLLAALAAVLLIFVLTQQKKLQFLLAPRFPTHSHRPFHHQKRLATEADLVHSNFGKAFANGCQFEKDGSKITIEVKEIGKFTTTSGKIQAGDPAFLKLSADGAFVRTVSPGTYPVTISYCKESQLIAAIKISFSNAEVSKWELAVRKGQSIAQLEKGEIYSYPVDGGQGSFVDAEEFGRLSEAQDELVQNKINDDLYIDALHHDKGIKQWRILPLADKSEANIVVCESGFGDGSYASWWGLDKSGKVVCLVTDFDILIDTPTTELWVKEIKSKLGEYITDPLLEDANITLRVNAGPDDRSLEFESNQLPQIEVFNGNRDISGQTQMRGLTKDWSARACDMVCKEKINADTKLKLIFSTGSKAL